MLSENVDMKTTTPKSLKVQTTGRAPSHADQQIRSRKTRRCSTAAGVHSPMKLCKSLPYSLEELDLSPSSPTQTLASLRFLVLSYLADLERRLAEFESPNFDLEKWKEQGEISIEEAKEWVRTALEMLEGIRADVCSHIPELPFADLTTLESFVRAHLPELPEMYLPEMYLPDMPYLQDTMSEGFAEMRSHIPNMEDVRSSISGMRHRLDDVKTRFLEDLEQPFSYIPTLSDHLENLHSHLSTSGFFASSFTPNNNVLADLVQSMLNSDLVQDILNSGAEDVIAEGEEMLERAAHDVAMAIKRSFDGVHLISYSDLPRPWQNNPFVTHGYRFIPIERWHLIVMSLFALHNETLNIHTHLIPFILWGINLIPYFRDSATFDTPELLFMTFALLCLSSSALWHTMSGCADHRSMELCARVDYVGIGWLISASVATVVHYGFACNENIGRMFLGLCLATGLAGNIFPFMTWFNEREYRSYRIGFFVALAFSGIGPMVALSLLHSTQEMLDFVSPVFPSLLSYIIGLIFYASHFPERIIPSKIQRKLDIVGCNSHAIWHCFIVLAVKQHKAAIESMRQGLQCMASQS